MTESYTVDGRQCSWCGKHIPHYELHSCPTKPSIRYENPFPPSDQQILTELRELRKLAEEINNKLR